MMGKAITTVVMYTVCSMVMKAVAIMPEAAIPPVPVCAVSAVSAMPKAAFQFSAEFLFQYFYEISRYVKCQTNRLTFVLNDYNITGSIACTIRNSISLLCNVAGISRKQVIRYNRWQAAGN